MVVEKLDRCQGGLTWYERIVHARQEVISHRARLHESLTELRRTIELIDSGRPDFDDPNSLETNCSSWTSTLPTHLQLLDAHSHLAAETVQKATVAMMRYRQVKRAPPKAWKNLISLIAESDELSEKVEQQSNDVLERVQEARGTAESAKQDAEILPVARQIYRASLSISAISADLHRKLVEAIDLCAWHAVSVPLQVFPTMQEVEEVDDRIKEGVLKPLAAIKQLFERYGRKYQLLKCHLTAAIDLISQQEHLRTLADLLARVYEQATVVRIIQKEAARMLVNIRNAQHNIDATLQTASDSAQGPQEANCTSLKQCIDSLAVEVKNWESQLAGRVPFVSGCPPASSTSGHHHSDTHLPVTSPPKTSKPLLPANVSAAEPPMTPPSSPPPRERVIVAPDDKQAAKTDYQTDLSVLDLRVRAEVNCQASHVSSALSHCMSSVEALSNRRSRARMTSAVDFAAVTSSSRAPLSVARVLVEPEQLRAHLGEAGTAAKLPAKPRAPHTPKHDVFGPTGPYISKASKLPGCDDPLVDAGDLSALPAHLLRQLSTASLGRASSRSTSNPARSASTYLTPTEASRNRAVSDTPSRNRLKSLGGDGVLTIGKGSLGRGGTKGGGTPLSGPASSSFRSKRTITPKGATTPRSRKASRPSLPKAYIADPKSNLDVAVGQVINRLKVCMLLALHTADICIGRRADHPRWSRCRR